MKKWDVVAVDATAPDREEREEALVADGFECYSRNSKHWLFRREHLPVKATRAAERIASENAVDLAKVEPTGAYDTIVKQDVLDYLDEREGGAPSADAPSKRAAPGAPKGRGEGSPLPKGSTPDPGSGSVPPTTVSPDTA